MTVHRLFEASKAVRWAGACRVPEIVTAESQRLKTRVLSSDLEKSAGSRSFGYTCEAAELRVTVNVVNLGCEIMMGLESHPLEADQIDSMESVTLDPLQEQSPHDLSSSGYSLVNSHPLTLDSSLEDSQQHFSREDDDSEEEPSSRISSTTGRNHLVHSSAPSDAEFLNIIVSQPKKELDAASSLIPGGSYFVTYLVTTKTSIPEYGESELNVRRRFKDIVALADSLGEKYRGYFIPSRPDKNIVESQIMDKHDFIEQRRLGIERYLRRLAEHPVLRKSEELRAFLVSKGKLPLVPTLDVASRMLDGAAKLPRQLFGDGGAPISPQDVVQSAKGGRDLLRLFKELKQSVTNDWGSTKPPVVEEDKEFLEKKEKLREFERQLSHATQQADVLLKAQADLAHVMGELGLSFLKLGKLETQQATSNIQRRHAADIRCLATAIVKTSRSQRGAHAQAERHLDQFHEHLAVLQSAHAAFSDRNNALLTVQTLLSDISMMHSRAEKHSAAASKVFGGDKSRKKKADDLKESIKVTEEACQYAQRKYDHIKENNRTETDRIEADKQKGFFLMLQGFVHSQVGYAEKISKEWTRAAEESAEYSGRRLESPMFRSNLSFRA